MIRELSCSIALTLLVFAIASADSGEGEIRRGRVVKVTSGDTFVLEDNTGVRMAGIRDIEVPIQWGENGRFPWSQAKDHLSSLVLGKEVRLVVDKSHRGYASAVVYIDKPWDTINVNMKMVADGYATADLCFREDTLCAFLDTEICARKERAGLWGDLCFDVVCDERPLARVDRSDWRVYANKRSGIELRIPPSAEVVESDTLININLFSDSTNGARLSLFLRVTSDTGQGCFRAAGFRHEYGGDKLDRADTVYLGSTEFYRWAGGEGAAGTYFQEDGYSTGKAGTCVTMSYTRALSYHPPVDWPLPSPDRDSQMALFDQLHRVVSSLRFTK